MRMVACGQQCRPVSAAISRDIARDRRSRRSTRVSFSARVREIRCGSNPCGGWGAGLLPPRSSLSPTSNALAARTANLPSAERSRPPAPEAANARRRARRRRLERTGAVGSLSILEPGPVVLLTTARAGRDNVMAMSWHMMVEFTPPLVACVVSDADYSFAALRATRECVTVRPGGGAGADHRRDRQCSGRTKDKFAEFGLDEAPPAARSRNAGNRIHGDTRQPRRRHAPGQPLRPVRAQGPAGVVVPAQRDANALRHRGLRRLRGRRRDDHARLRQAVRRRIAGGEIAAPASPR